MRKKNRKFQFISILFLLPRYQVPGERFLSPAGYGKHYSLFNKLQISFMVGDDDVTVFILSYNFPSCARRGSEATTIRSRLHQGPARSAQLQ